MEQASFELLDLSDSESLDLFPCAQPPADDPFWNQFSGSPLFGTPFDSLSDTQPWTTQPLSPTVTKKFNLYARNLFLTYPQCTADPTVVLERIKLWSMQKVSVVWAIVAQEHHQDGSLHLHCCVHLKKKRHFRKAACLDFLTQKHGNYRSCRNLQDVVR